LVLKNNEAQDKLISSQPVIELLNNSSIIENQKQLPRLSNAEIDKAFKIYRSWVMTSSTAFFDPNLIGSL